MNQPLSDIETLKLKTLYIICELMANSSATKILNSKRSSVRQYPFYWPYVQYFLVLFEDSHWSINASVELSGPGDPTSNRWQVPGSGRLVLQLLVQFPHGL